MFIAEVNQRLDAGHYLGKEGTIHLLMLGSLLLYKLDEELKP